MGLRSTLGGLLLYFGLDGICTSLIQGNCTNYRLQFGRVFSVPGDMAMLNSSLLSPDVFNYTGVPYNITWYNSKTGQEMTDQPGRILVRRETLWFLSMRLEDAGEYLTIVRTPFWCYMQSTLLVVDLPAVGECGRPRKSGQSLTNGVTDNLVCPLKDYVDKLDSYGITSSIKWHRGCDPIVDGTGRYTYRDNTKLKIDKVEPRDSCMHTCTLTFTLGGITGSVSETIDAHVKAEYSLAPQVREPANEIIKEPIGSNFSKRCLVFVPCVGKPQTDIIWIVKGDFLITTDPSKRVHTSEQRSWSEDHIIKGVWLERLLVINELKEEDFYLNYTCRAYNARDTPWRYFTLLPEDPNIMLPIGLLLGGVMILFVICVIIYYRFKVDIVLCFRRAFPVLYIDKDLDGKLFDAYVAYPQPCAFGFSQAAQQFALHSLPQVLEKTCGYKLFIAGRDCLPGQAVVDSVEENIQASRRLLLLYTASTFSSQRNTSGTSHNNNNNDTSKSSDGSDTNTTDSGSDEVCSDTRQQLECVAGMHRALLEGSLKVILVELEEISPAQMALFPESVRHLRKKQGAVCWWKNESTKQRRRTRDEETGGEDASFSASLSPSTRFWKEMRYHMPVRGKRALYPEKTALLNLR